MMKYEPIRVISQMTTSNARPIKRNLPQFYLSAFPTEHTEFPATHSGNPKRGEYITGFSRSKQVLAYILLLLRSSTRFQALIFLCYKDKSFSTQTCIDEFFRFE